METPIEYVRNTIVEYVRSNSWMKAAEVSGMSETTLRKIVDMSEGYKVRDTTLVKVVEKLAPTNAVEFVTNFENELTGAQTLITVIKASKGRPLKRRNLTLGLQEISMFTDEGISESELRERLPHKQADIDQLLENGFLHRGGQEIRTSINADSTDYKDALQALSNKANVIALQPQNTLFGTVLTRDLRVSKETFHKLQEAIRNVDKIIQSAALSNTNDQTIPVTYGSLLMGLGLQRNEIEELQNIAESKGKE